MQEFFLKLGVSLLIGFSVGVERQLSQNFTKKDIGVRDLMIVSLLGFLSTNILYVGNTFFYALFSLICILSVMGFYFYNLNYSKGKVAGFTTFFTIPTVFILSSLTGLSVPIWQILVFLGVMIFILKLKEEWNTFIDTIKDREVIDFILFLIVVFVVTPLISKDLSWDFGFYTLEALFIWKMVAVISILSFFSHFFTKYVTGKRAVVITGFLGGLVSSLGVVYLLTSNVSKKKLSFSNIYSAFIAAGLGSIARDFVVLYYVIPHNYLTLILLPIVLTEFILLTIIFFSMKKIDSTSLKFVERPMPLKTITKFVLVFFVVIMVSALINRFLPDFLYLSTFISGMMSSAAAVMAVGDLFAKGAVESSVFIYSVVCAIIGSFLSRSVLMIKYFPKQFLKILFPFFLIAFAMFIGSYVMLFQNF